MDPDVAVLSLPDVAENLGLPITRVHQMLRDKTLLAFRRGGVVVVPADFLIDGEVVKHLSGTLTLLDDGGYAPEDILRWMFTVDDSLAGTPIAALRSERSREIKRRAQAMAF
ncbi:DNA-binding protein [Pseudonocardiaceae bacterium YIM PH 21723]|nr:DNA-binding protein [Pseudonocardiaceae bacterium YIM PH 21723]